MMLLVEKLILKYNRSGFALKIDHLEVNQGEIVGIVGNNGAGKSSFFKGVLDLATLHSGVVHIGHINIKTSEAWKNFTCSFLDESQIIGFLTAEEYFGFVAFLYKVADFEKFLKNSLVTRLFNAEILNSGKLIHTLSTGNKQKIGIAAAFMSNPKIVFLDEPFSNLDPSAQVCLKEMVRYFNTQFQTTFLISSHNLQHLAEISSRILLFKKGKIESDFREPINQAGELEAFFK